MSFSINCIVILHQPLYGPIDGLLITGHAAQKGLQGQESDLTEHGGQVGPQAIFVIPFLLLAGPFIAEP